MLLHRISVEEKFLVSKFVEEYLDYSHRNQTAHFIHLLRFESLGLLCGVAIFNREPKKEEVEIQGSALAPLAQETTLVGREGELKVLDDLLNNAANGRGGLVMISGEAGIGKTNLVAVFGKRAAKKDAQIIVGRCVPVMVSAYLPFHDALSQIPEPQVRELGLGGWLRGGKALGRDALMYGTRPELESGRTLHEALGFFRELSKKTPLVLVLEDLHWADSASIQLLHFLARNCRQNRILIIGTFRPEDLGGDADGKPHPLLYTLRTMRREGIVSEVKLDILTTDELKEAVRAMFKENVDGQLESRIAIESGGNPLYAVELVRFLIQEKSVAFHDGLWSAANLARMEIPPSIRELVLTRTERVPKSERRVLETAAVIGEVFDPSLIGNVLGIVRLNVLETLDALQKEFQLVGPTEAGYKFSHERIREIIYSQISQARRNELHLKTAEAIEARESTDRAPAELSTHFLLAGDVARCVKYSMLAGENSLRQNAFRESAEFFERALKLTRNHSTYQEEKAKASEGLGDAEFRLGQHIMAASSYKNALDAQQNSQVRARLLRKLAFCESFTLDDDSISTEHLAEAEKLCENNDSELARIEAIRGDIALATGDFARAEALFAEARKSFEKAGLEEDLALAILRAGEAALSNGQIEASLALFKEAAEINRKLSNVPGERGALIYMGLANFHKGLYREALQQYDQNEKLGAKYGLPTWPVHAWKAWLYITTHSFELAKENAIATIQEADVAGNIFWKTAGEAFLALSEIGLGSLVEAEALLGKTKETVNSVLARQRTPLRGGITMAEAELHAAREEWDLCNVKYAQAIQDLRGAVFGLPFEAQALGEYGQALAKQGRMEDAQKQLVSSAQIYERIGNSVEAEKTRRIIQTLTEPRVNTL